MGNTESKRLLTHPSQFGSLSGAPNDASDASFDIVIVGGGMSMHQSESRI